MHCVKNMNDYFTICVATYNSSKFILEALESIRQQTYPYLDLIISDDKSTDETVSICKEWIEKNKSRFRNVSLVIADKNTGTAGNLNRGVRLCNTEWIKCMAGDDALYIDFISDFMKKYANSEHDVLLTDAGVFDSELNDDKLSYYLTPNSRFFSEDVENKQYKILLRRNFLGPSIISRKKIFDQVGGYDEKYPLIEDWPFLLKIAKQGNIIGMAPLLSTRYRLSDTSVRKKHSDLVTRFTLDQYNFEKDYIFSSLDFVGSLLSKRYFRRILYYNSKNDGRPMSIYKKLWVIEKKIIDFLWTVCEYRYLRLGGMKMRSKPSI